MAGVGQRFIDSGFRVPKPLIDVAGEPMITKAIKSLDIDGQFLFVIGSGECTEQIKQTILAIKPGSKFIEISYITDGPAASALLFKEQINDDEELIVTNCDQVMEWSGNKFLLNARLYDGAIVTYHTDTPKNSYARLDKKGFVREVREKEVLSNVSLNGIHYWKRGRDFVSSAEAMITANERSKNGEFYIGPTFNYMIQRDLKVGIHHIPNQQHFAVGTPEDLERYVKHANGST
jgi:NDP-sugar pyrophosphorylase family protein